MYYLYKVYSNFISMTSAPRKLIGLSFVLLLMVVVGLYFLFFSGPNSFKNVQTNVTTPFADVSLQHKYQKSINFLKDNGVIMGYADGTFAPDKPLTRAEFTKIVVLGSGQAVPVATQAPFPDVPLGQWYTDYVAYCAGLDYVKGYPDGTFKPNQEISKAEALKILGELVSWDLNMFDMSQATVSFKDVNLSQWYGPYLYYASSMHIIDDAGNLFEPSKPITRGQMAEYIYRDYVVRETGGAYTESKDSAFATGFSGTYANCSTADAALNILKEELIMNEPNKDILTVYQKPSSVDRGDYFQTFGDDGPGGTIERIDEKSWFFWIDLHPGERFSHDTKMAIVAFDGCAGKIYTSHLWPVVNGKELWNTDVKQNSGKDLVYIGEKANMHPEIATLPDPIMGHCNAPADSRKYAMIVFFGEDRYIKQDAVNMNEFLCNKGYLTVHIDSSKASPLTEIEDQMRTIAEISQRPGKSLNSFFFYVTSHGNKPTGDLVIRMEDAKGPSGEDIKNMFVIRLASLTDVMSAWAFGPMLTEAFTFVHDTCFSGNVVPLYQQKSLDAAAGVVGWVSASSQSNQTSLADKKNGSFHTNALMSCINDIRPYGNFAECIKGIMKVQWGKGAKGYNEPTPIIEKLTPETGNSVPFLP